MKYSLISLKISRLISTSEAAAQKLYEQSEVGPLRWMAPESLSKAQYSQKSDVWAFGITVIEIVTRKIPFSSFTMSQLATELVHGNIKPVSEISEIATRELCQLVSACTEQDPIMRIDFELIVQTLQSPNFKIYK